MTNDPYISFKKAADLAGVSKKTVERFHTKHKDHSDYTDAFEHRPDAKGAKYFIKESVVLRDIVKSGTENSTSDSDAGTAQQAAVHEVINQIKVKDEQLKEKDKQIENLQSSLHQEQVLHGRAQEKAHPSLMKSAIHMLVGRKEQEEGMPYSTPTPKPPRTRVAPARVRTSIRITFAVSSVTLVLLLSVKLILPLFL